MFIWRRVNLFGDTYVYSALQILQQISDFLHQDFGLSASRLRSCCVSGGSQQQQYSEVAVRLQDYEVAVCLVAATFRSCCASGGNRISKLLRSLMAAATIFRSCCASGGDRMSELLCVWWQQYFELAVRLMAAGF